MENVLNDFIDELVYSLSAVDVDDLASIID